MARRRESTRSTNRLGSPIASRDVMQFGFVSALTIGPQRDLVHRAVVAARQELPPQVVED